MVLIPPAARRSFAPWLGRLPGLHIGENDLTRIAPGRPAAQGELIEISGRASDEFGRPLRGVLIEIWNANTHGRYTIKTTPTTIRLIRTSLGLAGL